LKVISITETLKIHKLNMSKLQLGLFSLPSVIVLGVITPTRAATNDQLPQISSFVTSLNSVLDQQQPLAETTAVKDLYVQASSAQTNLEAKRFQKKKEASSSSPTANLAGQVIFGITSGLSGNSFSRSPIFGQRTYLEMTTKLGNGTLTTSLSSSGFGLVNDNDNNTVNTPEGTASFADGTTDNAVGIDLVKYDLPLGPNTQLTMAANAAGADDFTDSINPLFDGYGASGSISRFGTRPAIYYLVSGAGAGIRHQLSPTVEGSIGYLTSAANDPNTGLAGGGYGAIAQLTYLPNKNTKLGLTYVNAFIPAAAEDETNSAFGIGSANADNLRGNNNMFGVQASTKLSPKLLLGGWAGFNKNTFEGNSKDVVTWAVTIAFPDLGGSGNLGGLIVGQEPRVTAGTVNGTVDLSSSLHLEGFYEVKLGDNVSLTPGLIYLTATDQNNANGSALIGTIRTTFTF
jgi:Carbohydrate-selective porin, OprB family